MLSHIVKLFVHGKKKSNFKFKMAAGGHLGFSVIIEFQLIMYYRVNKNIFP